MRTLAITFSFLFIISFVSIGIAADDESLVAFYSFDGNAEDGSGNGNNGEIKNGSKFDKGKFGDAIYLDVGAHVEMAVSDTLHGDLFKSDPFTISVWINPTFEGGAWQQIWRSLPTASGHNTLFVNKDQGLLSWRGQVGGWTVLCQTNDGIVEKDKWTHVVVQSDGKKYRIYANGEMAQESDFQETRGENQIYRLGGEGGEGFGGALDDAAIFSRALDEGEIKAIMQGYEEFAPVKSKGKLSTIWAEIKK
ncbi:LamG domain-containing protein [Candidatus Poribacteria bacterium]|nr:LamG domain-containing protein [Candidatus Poribacteria bacterium]